MIVCCGEALIDMLPRSLDDGTMAFKSVSGGAIFNTAIALGRLGAPAGLLTMLSTDMFGDMLLASLQTATVETRYCGRSSQPSTLAFVQLVDGHARYSFFDEQSAGRSLTVEDLPMLDGDVSALHFGAISLIPEPCGGAYEHLLRSNTHRVISLDPNIRANFIQDEQSHRSRTLRMRALSDIVKVSDDDIEWIGEGRDHDSLVQEWLHSGTRIVLLTRGEFGSLLYWRDQVIEMPADTIRVVDTIGAGDTFNAGFLEGLRRSGSLAKSSLDSLTHEDLSSALKLATQVAALTCSKAGADAPWVTELNDG